MKGTHQKFLPLAFIPLMIGGLVLFINYSWAAITDEDLDAKAEEVKAEQSELQSELAEIQKQIDAYAKDLKTVQGEKNTLQNKLNQLNSQKSSLELEIKATDIRLKKLDLEIEDTEAAIQENMEKSENIKAQMSRLLNLIYQSDSRPLYYIIFSKNNLSEVYAEIEENNQMLNSLSGLLADAKELNLQLAASAEELEQEQLAAQDLQSIQSVQEEKLAASAAEQNTLLKETKGKESVYQANLADAKSKAAEIRGRLYSLLEVEKQINFGQAMQIAEWAGGHTGVRAAFLLAILTQESNLGKNVGTCNRAGDPLEKSYKVVMHPTRDQPPFLEITAALGRNPDETPISCPMHDKNGNQIGWGGAMGPAQFIPSTWIGYSSKVSAITGKPADPWDIRDAFLASAIKLGHDGATSIDGEWAAAMRYFSGGTNPAYSFYGDSVVSMADDYQKDIDELNQ